MTGWELRIYESMLWSREKAAREFGDTENMARLGKMRNRWMSPSEDHPALSVRDLLPHMQGMRKADIIRRLEMNWERRGCVSVAQPGRMPLLLIRKQFFQFTGKSCAS